MTRRLPLLILTGPTAVGKTELLEVLSNYLPLPIEIVSADAFQVYRGLDIGTAKPSPELRQTIPHHLIDIKSIDEPFNVADFTRLAAATIEDIYSRGKFPVVCGGTAFYLKHLIIGVPETPPSDVTVRTKVADRLNKEGAETLWKELKTYDPTAANRIHESDHFRIIRALEVIETSGRLLSEFGTKGGLSPDSFVIVGLTRHRNELIQRIDTRVDSMFNAGLLDEVHALIASGFRREDPGMKAIGYREFFEIENSGGLLSEAPGVRELIRTHTRQYAKRQMTFLRSLPFIKWFQSDCPRDVAIDISKLLRNSSS